MSDLSTNQHNLDGSAEACQECQELLGAYVLQALDRFDRGLVEQHLRWCDSCRSELEALQRIGTGLALGVPHVGAPSTETWAAIQARLQQDEVAEEALPLTAGTIPTQPAVQKWTRWLPASIIAPLALALILLGTWNWSLQKDIDQSEAELANHTLLNSTLTTSQQVQLYSMEQSCPMPTCEGVGQVGISQANSMGMVVGWDFDPQVTHDVWGVDHNGERSQVCSLVVAQDGAVMQMFHFPDTPSKFTDIYVTDDAGNLVYTSHITGDDLLTPPASTHD